ncbi:hypothetical protein [Maioricimonas sp. JC845]|uniref:hypothetical protein n=1 Tax=Maioricimonas sp. JC845 TaxID=3232138 RepID=UPI0034578928
MQQDRIDQFIARVRSLSLAEVEENLPEPELLVSLAGESLSGNEYPNRFVRVLADRRVSRLYDEYTAMPASRARSRASALFERMLAQHESRVDKAVAAYRERGAVDYGTGFEDSNHALAAATFLVSQFASPEDVVVAAERWRSVARAGIAAIEAAQKVKLPVPPLPEWAIGPDDLFILNIGLATLRANQERDESQRSVEDVINLQARARTEVALVRWDAETSPFDFTHTHMGAPVDDQDVLARFDIVQSWSHVPANTPESQTGFARRSLSAVRLLADQDE